MAPRKKKSAKVLRLVPYEPDRQPAELLQLLLDAVKAGEIKPTRMIVHFYEELDENRIAKPALWTAGVSNYEALTMTTLAQASFIDGIRGKD